MCWRVRVCVGVCGCMCRCVACEGGCMGAWEWMSGV